MIAIKAFRDGNIPKIFGKGKASPEEIEEAVKMLKDKGAIGYASSKAEEFVEKGKEKLELLPDSEAKRLLIELADYLIKRDY